MAHEGRREQFELLYRTHVRSLLAYALRRVDQQEDAADLVADTMLVAWRRHDEVPTGHEARLWLFGVARRLLANHRRGTGRRSQLGGRLRQELRNVTVADHADVVGTQATVRVAIGELAMADQEILRLAGWEGLEPREIATVLSIPAATARTQLHRARRRLRSKLDEVRPDPDERSPAGGHVDHDEYLLVRQPEDER